MAGECSGDGVHELSEPWAGGILASLKGCRGARRDAVQRDTHSAVADAFAQHPSAVKVVVAAFTGHYGLGGFTTRLIKNYMVDGSLA